MVYLFNFRFLKNVRLQNIFCTHLEEHDLNLIGTDKGLTNTIFFRMFIRIENSLPIKVLELFRGYSILILNGIYSCIISAAQIFSPQGLKGDVDIEISIKEYR